MGRPKKLKEGEVELNYVDVKTVAEAPELPSQDLKERKDFEAAPEGVADVKALAGVIENNTKTFEEVAASNSAEMEKMLAQEIPDDATKKEVVEEVHVIGHTVGVDIPPLGNVAPYFPVSNPEESNVFPPDEEPIPDVEDEGVDPDDIIDALVTRKPFVLEEELVQGGEAKGNPRAGQTAKNAAVRNVFTPNAQGSATNAPRVSSPATGVHKKPATVKSVEGNRSGMFIIDKKRPIRN